MAAVPTTVDEFLDLVRKSGVADEKRLDAYLATARADLPPEATKVAGLLVHHGILTNFQAENILAGKWRRFSIGKYKVLERLGSGGFAQVYLCEHKLMRRRVAVKVLPVAKTKDSSALERFYREARAVAALDHPNIVHAYDIDQDNDLHFLVMEYVDGANLQEIVQRSGPLSVVRAANYIWQAALALQHAHENGLVHRDIKPGNILVDRTGVVKVLDMGLALFFHETDEQLTKKHDDGTLGTADYLSPEQAMDSHDVDIRTDIYSLGVTFYFLLTGRPPFEGMQVAQKLLAQQMKQPKPVADFRKDVPAGLIAVLDKMMAKKVEERYAVPGETADALAPFVQTGIAPPTEVEMPRLSPAASGQPTGDFTPGSGRNVAAIASNPAPRVAPSSGAPHAKAAPQPVAVAPAPQAEEPGDAPWEQFATDTDHATARGDTTPSDKRRSGKSKTSLQADTRNPLIVGILVFAFILLPMCLVGVIGAVVWWVYTPPAPPTKAGPPKLEVSRDPQRKKTHTTIQAALRDAEIGSVIELWDETYDENVVLEASAMQRTSITLQAAPGKEIVWRSARNDPDVPILKVRKGVDFKLKGNGITFDGLLADKKRNVNNLITIGGDSPGLTIADATFKNYAHSALFVINSAGSESNPIKLHRLVIDPGEKGSAAIEFRANPKVLPPLNENIDIDDCDFRGIADPIRHKATKDNPIFGNNVRWPGR
jgi:eukaryotic-like serine/threonine-protein kinase